MKMHLPSTFILRYVRAKMIVHAFMMNLINWTIDIQENIKKKNEILYTKSMESCSLVISQILALFRLERATYKTLNNYFS